MRNVLKIAGIAVVLALLVYGYITYLNTRADRAAKQYAQEESRNLSASSTAESQNIVSTTTQPMTVTSSAFKEGEMIPSLYTCDGENVNPPLEISNVPDSAKSLAIIMDDPDAPNPFVHWVRFNIPASISIIEEAKGDVVGVGGMNSARKTTFVGSCPPTGTHHYHFKVYALDTEFKPTGTIGKKELVSLMQGHIVGETELVGLYIRMKNR